MLLLDVFIFSRKRLLLVISVLVLIAVIKDIISVGLRENCFLFCAYTGVFQVTEVFNSINEE